MGPLLTLVATACGSDGGGGAAATGGAAGSATAGSGGSAAGSAGTGAQGGTGAGGSSAGSSGVGGSAGEGSGGSGSMPLGPFLGSCDTRSVSGVSQGQCRDWYGENSGIDLSTSCGGLNGTFDGANMCPTDQRVGSCRLDPVLGVTAVYNYYAPDYTAETAKDSCDKLGGTFSASGGKASLTVERSGNGSGSVQITPPDVTCGGTAFKLADEPCSADVALGTSVTLVATPEVGSSFAGWNGGGCATDATCVVSVADASTVTATFTQPTGASWAVQFGGDSEFNGDTATGVAVDSKDDAIVLGGFSNPTSFGGASYTPAQGALLITKLKGADGSVSWHRVFDGPSTDNSGGVVVDSNDDIVFAASIWRTIDFGKGAVDNDRITPYAVKLLPDGSTDWVARFPAAGSSWANDIAVNGSNDVYLGGDADDGTSTGKVNARVIKLSGANGAEVWTKDLGATGRNAVLGVAATPDQGVVAGGKLDSGKAFVAKLAAADGAEVWNVQPATGSASSVAVDTNGDVFVTVTIANVLLKLSGSDGSQLWSVPIPQGNHIALDSAGNPVISGQFTNTFDTGSGTLISRGDWDHVVAKFSSSDGSVMWLHSIGGPGFDTPDALALFSNGDVILGGQTGGLEFDNDTALTASGLVDGFAARLTGL
ncbi:MAG: PQQ-binding-like beta-propeller repeat protein [Polyangiaceae bacterium]